MNEEMCYCEACGKEITCEEAEQFNGFCEGCFTELEITDSDDEDYQLYVTFCSQPNYLKGILSNSFN